MEMDGIPRIQGMDVLGWIEINEEVYYKVRVTVDSEAYLIRKRFCQFFELHKQLSKFAQGDLPKLPPKRSKLRIDHLDPSFLGFRQSKLDEFCDQIVTIRKFADSEELLTFCRSNLICDRETSLG